MHVSKKRGGGRDAKLNSEYSVNPSNYHYPYLSQHRVDSGKWVAHGDDMPLLFNSSDTK